MTYAEALALCAPFVCDDPDRVNLVRPWKQWIGDQPCLCAADGIAAPSLSFDAPEQKVLL